VGTQGERGRERSGARKPYPTLENWKGEVKREMLGNGKKRGAMGKEKA